MTRQDIYPAVRKIFQDQKIQQNIYSPARNQKNNLLAEFNRASAGTPAWDLEKYLLFLSGEKNNIQIQFSTVTAPAPHLITSPRHCTTAAQLAAVARWQCENYLWRNNFKQNKTKDIHKTKYSQEHNIQHCLRDHHFKRIRISFNYLWLICAWTLDWSVSVHLYLHAVLCFWLLLSETKGLLSG